MRETMFLIIQLKRKASQIDTSQFNQKETQAPHLVPNVIQVRHG